MHNDKQSRGCIAVRRKMRGKPCTDLFEALTPSALKTLSQNAFKIISPLILLSDKIVIIEYDFPCI